MFAIPQARPNPSTRTSPLVKRLFGIHSDFSVGNPNAATCGMKKQCDSEQTAHLQTALLHLPVRTQIRTAQLGSIRSTELGTIAATQG
jgi:hypothetical protein